MKATLECSGSTELWHRRAATFCPFSIRMHPTSRLFFGSCHLFVFLLPPFCVPFGAIEWVLDGNHAWLTHYEYYFGRPDKNNPKGIVVDVSYDRFETRLLPSRSTRLESGVKTETIRGATSAAKTNLEFYSPAAFGLVRPAKPWQSYQIWGLLGLGAASVGIGLRWWRTRTIRYSN